MMNHSIGKTAMFTGPSLTIHRKSTPEGEHSPPVSPPAEDVESPSSKKKKKKKKRNSRSTSMSSTGPDNEEEEPDYEVQHAPGADAVRVANPKSESVLSPASETTASFDGFADNISSVVVPSTSPVADAASGPPMAPRASPTRAPPPPPPRMTEPVALAFEPGNDASHAIPSEAAVVEVVEGDAEAASVVSDLDSSMASAQASLDAEFVVQEATTEIQDEAEVEIVSETTTISSETVSVVVSETMAAEEIVVSEEPTETVVEDDDEPADSVSKSLSTAFDDVSDDEEEAELIPDQISSRPQPSDADTSLPVPPEAVNPTNNDGTRPTAVTATTRSAGPPPSPVTKREISRPTATKPSAGVAKVQSSPKPAANAVTKPSSAKPPSLQRASSGSAAARTAKTPPKPVAGTTSAAKTPPKPITSTASAVASASTAASRARQAAIPPPSPSKSAETEPKVIKKKLSASEVDAAGNRLYEQAMESKRKLEAKKAELEKAYSFTPQVNHTKFKKQESTEGMSRFDLLHEKAKESQRKKEELREQMEKEHSFKPQITNKAKKIGSATDKPRYENLYKNAQEIQAKREEKKKLVAEKDQEELTFKPKIKTTKSPARSKPLYDPEVVNKKRAELEQKKLEAEAQSKPKPVKKTKPPADGDSSFFDRLAQSAQQKAERLAKLKQERENAEMANATFKPKVSEAASGIKTAAEPFHQRLYDRDHLKKVAAEREQRKLHEEKLQFTFKPRVSDVPDGIKSKGSSNSGSAGKSTIFERLYQDKDRVKEKIELSEELKVQKEMEECTFRPQIDVPPTVAVKSESTTPIWERLLSIDKNQIAEERDRLKSMKELEACTFRPEISPTPGSLSPKRPSAANIYDRLSISAGNTPVDEKKRERKAVTGQNNSFSERGEPRQPPSTSKPLSGTSANGSAIIREKLSRTPGGLTKGGVSISAKPSEGSLEAATWALSDELAQDELSVQSKSIVESYDVWAAGMEEKLRSL